MIRAYNLTIWRSVSRNHNFALLHDVGRRHVYCALYMHLRLRQMISEFNSVLSNYWIKRFTNTLRRPGICDFNDPAKYDYNPDFVTVWDKQKISKYNNKNKI